MVLTEENKAMIDVELKCSDLNLFFFAAHLC
jgi:hypothetical protein